MKKKIIVLVVLLFIGGMVYYFFADIRSSADKKDKIAIQGYDIISLHKEGKVRKGTPQYTHFWNAMVWRFISQKNLEIFRSDPDSFNPAYGGNCAFTTSMGKAQMGLAKYWMVRNNRLFFNANWVSHQLWKWMPSLEEKADRNWMDIIAKKNNISISGDRSIGEEETP